MQIYIFIMDAPYNFYVITSPHLEEISVLLIVITPEDIVIEYFAGKLPYKIMSGAQIAYTEKVTKIQATYSCSRFKEHDYTNTYTTGLFTTTKLDDIRAILDMAKNVKNKTYVFEISPQVLQENQAEGPCHLLWISVADDSSAAMIEFEEMPFADKMRDAQCVHVFDETDMATRVSRLTVHAWHKFYPGLWIQAPLEDIKNSQYQILYIIAIPHLGPHVYLIWYADDSFTLDTLKKEDFAHALEGAIITAQYEARKEIVRRIQSLIDKEIVFIHKFHDIYTGRWICAPDTKSQEYISMSKLEYKKLKTQYKNIRYLQPYILAQLIEKLDINGDFMANLVEPIDEIDKNPATNPITLARKLITKLIK